MDDPIFIAAGDGRYVQTGFVSNVDGTRGRAPVAVSETQIVVYDTARSRFFGWIPFGILHDAYESGLGRRDAGSRATAT